MTAPRRDPLAAARPAVRRGPARRACLAGLLLAGLTAGLAGCAGPAPAGRAAAAPAPAALVRTELLFGRARADGSPVSDAEWRAFVDEHVTPRFPDGLTVIEARGQYRTRSGRLVREPSMVLILLHDGSRASRARIEEIRTLYKRLFDQESVLLISVPADVSF